MRPLYWIIKSDRFGTILCKDGKFYGMAPIESFKTYKREGDAANRLDKLKGCFTAFALYDGDTIDCCGRINHTPE